SVITELHDTRRATNNALGFQSRSIPEFDRFVLEVRRQDFAVWRPDCRCPRRQTGEGRLPGLWASIPNPHRFVLAATGQPAAIGRKRHRPNSIVMALERVELAPGSELPQFDCLVQACGSQYLPIRRK